MSLCARGSVRHRGRSVTVSARHKCRSMRRAVPKEWRIPWSECPEAVQRWGCVTYRGEALEVRSAFCSYSWCVSRLLVLGASHQRNTGGQVTLASVGGVGLEGSGPQP